MFESTPQSLRIPEIVKDNAHYESAKRSFELCFDAANNFQLSLKKAPARSDLASERQPLFVALLALLKASLQTLMGVALLANEGLLIDSNALCRSLYERLLTMVYMNDDATGQRGSQFLRSTCLHRKRLLDWAEDPKTPDNVKKPEFLQATARINKEFESFMKDFFPRRDKAPNNWHGLTLKDMIEDVNTPRAHEHGYKLMNAYTHCEIGIIRMNETDVWQHGAHRAMNACVMPGEVGNVLGMATAAFVESWKVYAKTFQPSSLDLIARIRRDLKAVGLAGLNANA